MPRLDGSMEVHSIGKGGFAFTGARMDKLGATDYTLVTLATDVTGSVSGFVQELQKMEQDAIASCQKSPRADNVMIRLIRFSSMFQKGVEEVFGFMPLADIDVANLPAIHAGGGTPLCDAVFSTIAATNEYAQKLRDNDFGVNSIVFVITDGEDNASAMNMATVKREQQLAVTSEQLESHIAILVGINTQQCGPALQQFQQEAGMTQYVDAGDATPQRLAKLAQFVSRSISSQSQALGTGGPSQNIQATI